MPSRCDLSEQQFAPSAFGNTVIEEPYIHFHDSNPFSAAIDKGVRKLKCPSNQNVPFADVHLFSPRQITLL